MVNSQPMKNRIHFLDELRGFAVFCMVFYHAFYFLGTFFEQEWAENLFYFFFPVQPLFAAIFIFVCGISCTLSRSNVKRGLILLGVALGFTLVTAVIMPKMGFVECEIYFGIIHFLSASILIYSLFSKKLLKMSPFVGILLCVFLYAFTSGIGRGELAFGELVKFNLPVELYETDFLVPLGIYSPSFFSADYFPLFPNIFIFFAGAFCGNYYAYKGCPEWCYPKRIPFFGFLGRNALIIYIVHMPAVFAVAYGIDFVINLF